MSDEEKKPHSRPIEIKIRSTEGDIVKGGNNLPTFQVPPPPPPKDKEEK